MNSWAVRGDPAQLLGANVAIATRILRGFSAAAGVLGVDGPRFFQTVVALGPSTTIFGMNMLMRLPISFPLILSGMDCKEPSRDFMLEDALDNFLATLRQELRRADQILVTYSGPVASAH